MQLSNHEAAFIRSVLRSYLAALQAELAAKNLTTDKFTVIKKEVDDTLKALSFL